MFSPEMISLVGGTLGGAALKIIGQAQANRQAQFNRMMGFIKAADDSSDRAAARSNNPAGDWIRRIIVCVVLLGIIVFPFLLTLIDKPIIVEVHQGIKDWFFGLFSTGGNSKFYQINGYILSDGLKLSFLSLIGFYFGVAAVRNDK